MSMSRIAELANTIAKHVAQIDQQLLREGVASPSFDISAPRLFPKNEEMEIARDTVLSATTELRALVLGPKESLQVLAANHNELVSLNAISRFKLASSFPVGEETTYREIAKDVGLTEATIRRILRHSMINNIFAETENGTVMHSAASALLAEDQDMRDFVAVATEDLWRAATYTVDALEKWPLAEEPSQTGFSIANDTKDPFFIELGKDPKRTARFAGAMRAFSSGGEYEASQHAKSFDWGSLGKALVVDVGGSHGAISLSLAEQYPELRFIVQDLGQVLAKRPKLTENSITARVEFMEHNFFSPQPVAAAEVYYFRWIFHNWAKSYCVKILRALIPALRPGSLIVLNDICVPDRQTLSVWQGRRMRHMDLAQLVLLNSAEREAAEWEDLFKTADERFNFKGITPSSKRSLSGLAIIVAEWTGEKEGESKTKRQVDG